MKKRYLIPILLVILIAVLGVSCDTSSKLTADEEEQRIIELQRQNEELRQQLDELSTAVEGLKQKQSNPSYQPPVGRTGRTIEETIEKMEREQKELDAMIDFATGKSDSPYP